MISVIKIILILGVTFGGVCGEFEVRNFTQWLDHFDPNNTATWEQRYWIDDSHYVPGSPIFLLVGDMTFFFTEFRLNESFFIELAQEFNGLMVATEHRFYGESRPTPDVSLESLQFLRTDLALADYVEIIKEIRESREDLREAKVIAAGSGHGAALAIWLRQSYPEVVDGVWSSSARMYTMADFDAFGTNTAISIRIYGGMTCYYNLAAAFSEMENLFANGEYEVLRDGLQLCDTERGIEGDYAGNLLFAQVAAAVGTSIQAFHSVAFTNLCGDLANGTTYFQGLANWVTNRVFPEMGCIMIDYEQFLEFLRVDDWEADSVVWGTRQMMYQACTEFGWYRTSSGPDHPFGDRFPIDFFFTQCNDLLNATMTPEEITQNIARTNDIYGGLRPNVTNVYFTNGNLDPERTLSVQEDLNESAIADNVSYFGFAADWIPSEFVGYDGLANVQERLKHLVAQWINDNDGEVPTTTESPETLY
ncbi:thymus-specific serine protease-like [Lutzomyia longipalpis]|uniref:thymus-specific serine protease-like n=1 Tax=Lutzomyia longipalpis TaxID=7200 RepID=UPI002483611E|nr:thymus-specific serine protease-like [Lutzomyia longipalpis]